MAAQPHVLIVEDEEAQREVLAYNLEAQGFRVTRAEDGEEGLLMVSEDPPDVMVLDWMLPRVTGIEICRRLKMDPATRGIAIIMLSARSEEFDKVRGLETGADDYVTKPYSVTELMARVRSQLRRVRPTTVGQTLAYDDILLDRVWGRDIYVDTRTVDVQVGRLRKALTATGGTDPVRTVRGAGYALG